MQHVCRAYRNILNFQSKVQKNKKIRIIHHYSSLYIIVQSFECFWHLASTSQPNKYPGPRHAGMFSKCVAKPKSLTKESRPMVMVAKPAMTSQVGWTRACTSILHVLYLEIPLDTKLYEYRLDANDTWNMTQSYFDHCSHVADLGVCSWLKVQRCMFQRTMTLGTTWYHTRVTQPKWCFQPSSIAFEK